MIQCSPQELIAESLSNCFQSNLNSKNLQSARSFSKPILHMRPQKLIEKTSLKKSLSQNKFPTQYPRQYQYYGPPSFHEIRIMNVVPINNQHIVHSFPIENKINFYILPPRKEPLFQYFSQTFPEQTAHFVQNKVQKENYNDQFVIGRQKMSQAETHNSYSSIEDKKMKTIPHLNIKESRENRLQKAIDPQGLCSAEKNQEDNKKCLTNLHPKETESESDNSPRLSEQRSIVIRSYFPKIGEQKLTICKSRTNQI